MAAFDNGGMAYLILSTDGEEWDRRVLTGPIVLGRSPDCDISVHDILLSRRHCRFTPVDGNWLLIDLASRNGTHLRDRVIEQCQLKHGDIIRVGKTRVTYRADAFMPRSKPSSRPAIPPAIIREEQLAGTVDGLRVIDPTPPAPAATGDAPTVSKTQAIGSGQFRTRRSLQHAGADRVKLMGLDLRNQLAADPAKSNPAPTHHRRITGAAYAVEVTGGQLFTAGDGNGGCGAGGSKT